MSNKTSKVMNVKLDDIKVGERFREDMGDLEALAADIKKWGIVQPLSINQNYELLAGGRRYHAAREAGFTEVPVIILETENELQAREIELLENIARQDFSWQEKVRLTKRIHELQQEIHGDKWSKRQTATLLPSSRTITRDRIELAEAMEVVPELADAKTEDEANRRWKKLQEEFVVQQHRKRQQQEYFGDGGAEQPAESLGEAPASPKETTEEKEAVEKSQAKEEDQRTKRMRSAASHYRVMDTFDGLSELADLYQQQRSNITFIECDPPYGIELPDVKRGSGISYGETYDEIASEEYNHFLGKLTEMLYNVAADDAWMVFWYGPSWHTEVKAALTEAGWLVDDIPGIWVKGQGQTNMPDRFLARGYEPFFICRKGEPVLRSRGRTNVFSYAPVSPSKKYHATERPMELIQDLIQTFMISGIALVPFLGSGKTLRALYKEGKAGFGFDISDAYKDRFLVEVEQDMYAEEQEAS